MEDFIRLGAYKPGVDKTFDEAFDLAPQIENAMTQMSSERISIADSFARLETILHTD
jgi:flagellum-specific ATP synthase